MRTLVILTGGTFGSILAADGLAPSRAPSDESRLQELSKQRISSSVELSFCQPFSKLSENITPCDWTLLFHTILQKKGTYDNVLIVHGTDTMAYTSAALSYLNALFLNTTIVLTGANKPFSLPQSDAPANFIQSLKALEYFYQKRVKGCFIVFNGFTSLSEGAKIHLGNRVKKDKWDGSCYRSYFIGKNAIGQVIGTDEVLFDLDHFKRLTFSCSYNQTQTASFASKQALAIKIYPGLDPMTLPVPSENSARYYIIELYNSGTAPADKSEYSLVSWVTKVIDLGGAVFAVSQHEGQKGVYMDIYESSVLLRRSGVIPLRDMIWEAAIPKLMLAAQNCDTRDQVCSFMQGNICGEISVEPTLCEDTTGRVLARLG